MHVEYLPILGLTLKHFLISDTGEDGNVRIDLATDDGRLFVMQHHQDCCESVILESLDGDINDIIGKPLVMAEKVTEEGDCSSELTKWTFYKLATIEGGVTLRFHGSSNGYYSVDVDFSEFDPNRPSEDD